MKTLLSILFLTGFIILSPAQQSDRPNIILIFVDDLGYGDLGCYGNERIKTPHLDRLAKEGQRWTSFYSSGATCVPSRRGLMTGRHPSALGRSPEALVPSRESFLPAMFQGQGYRTALIGKWHLAGYPDDFNSHPMHPLECGFDYFYGTPGSNDAPGPPKQTLEEFNKATSDTWFIPMIRDREVIAETVQQEQFTSLYTTEAVKWIDDHRDQPFFLYLAHNMPHAPIIAPARREIVNPSPTSPEPFGGSAERSASSEPEISRLVEVEDPYGDVIEGLDRSVGAIVSATEAAQIAENTLIIFTSDNGPWTVFGPRHAGTAAPLRGEKSTTWEGGMRVPTIFYWPGKIAPAVIDGIGANLDLYATFAALVGGEEPSDLPGYQSEDLCGTLLDAEPSPRTTWLYERSAYRSGDFKIHLQTRSPTNPHTRQKTPSISHDPPLLYNLADDPGENHNIAGQHPEVVARLRAESAELLTQ